MWQFYSSTCTYPWYIILNFCIIKYLFRLVIDLQDNKFKVQKYKLFCVLSFDDLYIIKDACEQEIINISWLEIKLNEYCFWHCFLFYSGYNFGQQQWQALKMDV